MKKDAIATPLLPFTSDEESALVERLGSMDAAAIGHYVECAQLALRNTALDPSWRPRVEIGLKHAEAAALKEAAAAALALEAAAAVAAAAPPVPAKGKKAEAA
jgi:hypothetical protein